MKHIFILILISATLSGTAQNLILEIGDNFPEHTKKLISTTSGTSTLMSDLKQKNGLLVIFSCNSCPFVIAWEDRYPMINEIAKANQVAFVLVNSNETKRNGSDSEEAMKAHAKKLNYQWPYLVDEESGLANAFGAQTTPHVFLFDKNLKLVYKGAIDDNYKDASAVEEFYLKSALQSLGKGEAIQITETRNLGCSIKRKSI